MKMSRRTAAIAGSIATLAVAGTLIAGPAFAKGKPVRNNQSSNSQNAVGRMGDMMGGHGRMGDMDGDHGMPMGIARGQMLHSEGVIARTDNTGTITYVTVRQQHGKVTAASDTSVTVKSDDGYTTTWPVSASTRVVRAGAVAKASAFVVGDVVEARGTVGAAGVTTDDIHDHAPRVRPLPAPAPTTSGSNA